MEPEKKGTNAERSIASCVDGSIHGTALTSQRTGNGKGPDNKTPSRRDCAAPEWSLVFFQSGRACACVWPRPDGVSNLFACIFGLGRDSLTDAALGHAEKTQSQLPRRSFIFSSFFFFDSPKWPHAGSDEKGAKPVRHSNQVHPPLVSPQHGGNQIFNFAGDGSCPLVDETSQRPTRRRHGNVVVCSQLSVLTGLGPSATRRGRATSLCLASRFRCEMGGTSLNAIAMPEIWAIYMSAAGDGP